MTDTRATVMIAQAMALAGVTRRTIYYWLKANRVQAAERRQGKALRLYVDSLPQKRGHARQVDRL
jgi:hypothetical protein